MLIKVDAKGLEWRTAVELSRDETALKEIIDGADQHEDNRIRFGLPSRLIAKTFLFRLIYGGSAFAYAKDFNFAKTSTEETFWQDVIDKTYDKYWGLGKWHERIVDEVQRTQTLVVPSGRTFKYAPEPTYGGKYKWPRTKILNYPVQGFSADLMQIARISAWNRLKGQCLFINTVHDDIQIDVDNDPEKIYNICTTLENVFRDIPQNVKKVYKYEMVVPMAGEVSFGNNLLDLVEFDATKGKEQFLCKSK